MSGKKKVPTPEDFFKVVSLYDVYIYSGMETYDLARIIYFDGTLDSFCVECGRNATFRRRAGDLPSEFQRNAVLDELRMLGGIQPDPPPDFDTGSYEITLECTRDTLHEQLFYVLISDTRYIEHNKPIKQFTFQKIGQHPSAGDLNIPGIVKYKGLLGKQRFREFASAIGLASHDFGIGAYAYLRRLFESLIEEAHESAKRAEKWDEEAYKNCRMTEKIAILQGSLPTFLVNNPNMYSILSKGIHDLSEDECLKHFPALRICVELILNEKLEEKEKQNKIKQANSALSATSGELSGDK